MNFTELSRDCGGGKIRCILEYILSVPQCMEKQMVFMHLQIHQSIHLQQMGPQTFIWLFQVTPKDEYSQVIEQ